jgi:hypothetical protein
MMTSLLLDFARDPDGGAGDPPTLLPLLPLVMEPHLARF